MQRRQYFRPKRKVKLSKHWCVNCDAALTSGYSRCPNCGFIEVNHRIRDIKKTMSERDDEY